MSEKKSKPIMRKKLLPENPNNSFADIFTCIRGTKVILRQECLFNSYCSVSTAINLHHLLPQHSQTPAFSALL